jgi:hypothetical protein
MNGLVPSLLLVLVFWPAVGRAAPAPGEPATSPPQPAPVFDRAPPRGLTRLRGSVRPFFSLLGQGAGAIADLSIDHYFADFPARVSLEMAPLALAIEADGPGSIAHLRAAGAYAGDYVEIGLAAGSRIQNYGGSGISFAASLRLGAFDGYNLSIGYGYVLRRNRYTGRLAVAMSNATTAIEVPLSHDIGLFADAGLSSDLWMYASAGLRHRLKGLGGPGTWIVSGSFGVAWVLDRPECPYPDTGWCTSSAWAAGPTLGLGLERRF